MNKFQRISTESWSSFDIAKNFGIHPSFVTGARDYWYIFVKVTRFRENEKLLTDNLVLNENIQQERRIT